MISQRPEIRTHSRIAAAAVVLLFAAALFCGCAAAGTISSETWTADQSKYLVTTSNTVSSTDVVIDGAGHTLTLSGGSTGSGSGYSWLGQVTINSGCTLTIRNLNIKGQGTLSGYESTGAVIGKLLGIGTLVLDNVTLNGVTIGAGRYGVGGLVGYANSASSHVATRCTVERCYIYSSGRSNVGGLVGYAYSASTIVMKNCRVADCVLWANTGYCGGLVGKCECYSGYIRSYQNNVVSNCVIYTDGSTIGDVGGIIGSCDTSTVAQTCSGNTVEYCTIANKGTGSAKNAGGIAGKFPSAGALVGNIVKNTCVVSTGGAAAGICPAAV